MPNSRGLRMRTRTMPLSTARPTMLVAKSGSMLSGKSETMSICMGRLVERRRHEVERRAFQSNLSCRRVDLVDVVVDERDLAARSAREATNQHVGARIG